jgi:peptidoglycan-associated lipoprotein
MFRASRRLALFALAPLAVTACKKKPAPAPTPAPEAPVTTPVAPVTPPAPVDTMAAARARIEAARASLLETVYFAYDSDVLELEERVKLDAKLAVLNANPQLRIRISGHCDERGSDEYNLVLGRKRAEAAKRYLTDRGIDPSRIETMTFGRERPAVLGSGEEAWAKNRRDEFEIIAGGDQLRAP